MKQICWVIFLLFNVISVSAQSGRDSSAGIVTPADTPVSRAAVLPTQKDTTLRVKKIITRSTKITDSIRLPKDTAAIIKDSSPLTVAGDSGAARQAPIPARKGESYRSIVLKNPWYNFNGQPVVQTASKREEAGREGQFYLLCGVILIFALIKSIFGKYLQNLFAVFFRVSMKQKQLREQLLQTPLPSLLLNLLFIISGGIYISYVMQYYGVMKDTSQGVLFFYAATLLAVIYIAKLLILKLTGWIFNMREATDTYIFVVFLVNKLLGIFLLPLILFIAFSDSTVVSVMITLSYVMIIVFFGYRYLISYSAVRKEIKVSPFHFFLYLCAFEIIPLVLIYKVLLEFVYRSP